MTRRKPVKGDSNIVMRGPWLPKGSVVVGVTWPDWSKPPEAIVKLPDVGTVGLIFNV